VVKTLQKGTWLSKVIGSALANYGFIFLALAYLVNFSRAAPELDLPLANPYAHAHRQTQTAIAIRQYAEDGLTLLHEIPTFGEPWVLPMEFPVYQWVAATLARRVDWSIEKVGRVCSLIILYASIPLLIWLLTSLDRTPQQASCIAAMVLLSPTYQFWGRSVMIESTALFFSIGYVAAALSSLRYDGDRLIRVGILLIALLCGILAALIKITTFAVAFGFVVLVVAVKFWKREIDMRQRGVAVGGLVLATVVSILCGRIWVGYADRVKETGLLTVKSTSASLHDWNYGTLALRLTPEYWRRFWDWGVQEAMPTFQSLQWGPDRWLSALNPLAIVAFVLCVVWFATSERKNIPIFLAFLLAFASGPLVFANLYFEHTYYWYANLWLLIVGIFYVVWDPGVWSRAYEQLRSDSPHVSIVQRGATVVMMLIAVGLGLVTAGAWKFHEYSDWQAFDKLGLEDKNNWLAMRSLSDKLPNDDDRKGVYLYTGSAATPEVPYFIRRRTLYVRLTAPEMSQGNALRVDETSSWNRAVTAEAISLQQKGYRIEGIIELFPKYFVDPQVRRSFMESLSLEEGEEVVKTESFRCALLKKM
jgi:hypothetical protein